MVSGAGLGLRREILGAQQDMPAGAVDFMELAPENWIGVGGRLGRVLRAFTERHPFVAHGLSLSLGGPAPFDPAYLRDIRRFLDDHGIRCYSEHLSWCADDRGQLYDLMPMPFTDEAVAHMVARIRQVQDAIGRRMAIEHVSYYAAPGQQMGELEFINAVLSDADCDLLLDVNNVYVNSVNFAYDPLAFIDGLPLERVAYVHIAGHYDEAPGLKIDTHGSAVIEPVWELLAHLYRRAGPLPTLLERDFNFPPMPQLLDEVQRIRSLQAAHPQARQAG